MRFRWQILGATGSVDMYVPSSHLSLEQAFEDYPYAEEDEFDV